MKRTPVNSSLIASVGLEERPDGPVMEIEFVNGKGSVYQLYRPQGTRASRGAPESSFRGSVLPEEREDLPPD